MFGKVKLTIHLPDIIFLCLPWFLIGFVISAIYPYDQTLAWYLLTPTIIMYIAYAWKFWVTSVKKEDTIDSPQSSLKSSLKIRIPAKRFFEA